MPKNTKSNLKNYKKLVNSKTKSSPSKTNVRSYNDLKSRKVFRLLPVWLVLSLLFVGLLGGAFYYLQNKGNSKAAQNAWTISDNDPNGFKSGDGGRWNYDSAGTPANPTNNRGENLKILYKKGTSVPQVSNGCWIYMVPENVTVHTVKFKLAASASGRSSSVIGVGGRPGDDSRYKEIFINSTSFTDKDFRVFGILNVIGGDRIQVCHQVGAGTTPLAEDRYTYVLDYVIDGTQNVADPTPVPSPVAGPQGPLAAPAPAASTPSTSTTQKGAIKQSPPVAYVDAPTPDREPQQVSGVFVFKGWAADPDTKISKVRFFIDGKFVGDANHGLERPDKICNSFPKMNGCPVGAFGWEYGLDTKNDPKNKLSNGLHKIKVDAYDNDADTLHKESAEVTFSVANEVPATVTLTPEQKQALATGGTPKTTSPGVATGGTPATGATQQNPATPTPEQKKQVATGGTPQKDAVTGTNPPELFFDNIADGQTVKGDLSLTGWVLDNTKASETGVSSFKMTVDGKIVSAGSYGDTRSDVCGKYPGRPNCPNVGWHANLKLADGDHTVTIEATDSDKPSKHTGSKTVKFKVDNNVVATSQQQTLFKGTEPKPEAKDQGFFKKLTGGSDVKIEIDNSPQGRDSVVAFANNYTRRGVKDKQYMQSDANQDYIDAVLKNFFNDKLHEFNGDAASNYPFSDSGIFVSTVMRASNADPKYPKSGVQNQLSYVEGQKDKYDVKSAKSTADLTPGDIVFMGDSSGYRREAIFVGPVSKIDDFPAYNAVEAIIYTSNSSGEYSHTPGPAAIRFDQYTKVAHFKDKKYRIKVGLLESYQNSYNLFTSLIQTTKREG